MTDDADDSNLPERLDAPEVVDADLGGLGAGLGDALGGLDLGSLVDMAQSMQAQMAQAEARIAESVVEGQSGGGAVKISVNGNYEFERVEIDPASIDPDDPSMLEDLILAALHDATSRIDQLRADASPLGGLDLGGLGAMFGSG
jgi:DNA-binding YbaB/EbfC family protein